MMPESPYYLIRQGRRSEAITSLAKLRSKSEAAVENEANEIQASHFDFQNANYLRWYLFHLKIQDLTTNKNYNFG